MKCIQSRTINYHYQCRFPPTKEEALLCSFCLELLLGCVSSFLVFLTRPSTCYDLFQVAPFVTNDNLQNVLTCKFTKNGTFCEILLRSEVLLQNEKIFILQNGASGIT